MYVLLRWRLPFIFTAARSTCAAHFLVLVDDSVDGTLYISTDVVGGRLRHY